MTRGPHNGPGPSGPWPDAGLSRGSLGAEEVLARAVLRSGEEARDVRESARGTPNGVFLARAGDLARSQWFLWAWATLAAGERLGRASARASTRATAPLLLAPSPSPAAPSPRTLVLGTVASDLYVGYAALRERARWFPGMVRPEDWELAHRRGAGRLLDAARALGGTLIKAGQFASTRPDLLPAAYVEGLSSLQDRVPPQPRAEIEGAVARELGRPIPEVFSEFDGEPIAAASIAQVHRARLRDGRPVAVKVQYPGIAALVEADLEALESIFGALARLEPGVDLRPIADYLRWTLPLELDFRREADAIAQLRDALTDRDDVVIPGVVGSLSTERLLVMELVEGTKITDRDGLVAAGLDPREVAELLNDAFADQLFRRGVLHADPHPGNLLVQPGPVGGPRLVLLDHGLTLALEPHFVAALGGMVSAIRDGDLEALTGALGEAGLPVSEETDLTTLLGLVGVLLGGEREGLGADLEGLGRRLGTSVAEIPPRLLLVGRAIGLLDGITRQLDPDLDALGIVARYTGTA
jgi:predicted unusual protein kinase regulating ubiquinone biosynthesis (AarF/ABC1/UbiB family)